MRIPERFKKKEGEIFLLPRFHVFGSEELSALSPSVAQLAPGAVLELSPEDARFLGLSEGNQIEAGGRACRVQVNPDVPPGTALISVLNGISGGLNGFVRINRIEAQ